MTSRSNPALTQLRSKNWLEWTVFGISIALIASTVLVLTHQAIMSENRDPQLSPRLSEPTPEGAWLRVAVRIDNKGGRTAQDVRVSVSAASRDGNIHTATCLFDFIPGSGSREGVVMFPESEGKASAFKITAVSYTVP